MNSFDFSQRIGTASGMLLIVVMQIKSDEVLKTIFLAGIGGISSYLFTLAAKYLIVYIKKKYNL